MREFHNDPQLLPQALSYKVTEGYFQLDSRCFISMLEAHYELGQQFANWLRPATGFELRVKVDDTEDNRALSFYQDDTLERLGDEGYILEITPKGLNCKAYNVQGLFYGAQSIRQLFSTDIFSKTVVNDKIWQIPCAIIEDKPRFTWRGTMLDVSRHFFKVDDVKRFIELLAMHKINVFHWHLTDDQGWRIEIKKYPRLTEVGSKRRETLIGHALDKVHKFDGEPYSGFYTQEEIKEIVAHAAKHHITVIPEIDMPGHATAAVVAYPELGYPSASKEVETSWGIFENVFNFKESTFEVLGDILDEVAELFPSEYVHIGGDEVLLKQWQQYEETELESEPENLLSIFVKRIETILESKGKTILGWDELVGEASADKTVIMSWRSIENGIDAVEKGYEVVMTPETHTYFDHSQAEDLKSEPLSIGNYTSLEKVYGYQPIPKDLAEELKGKILGLQAQLWTEYIPSVEHLHYMTFPRLCALAEVAWSVGEENNYDEFLDRLRIHLKRLDQLGINYRSLE